MRSRTLLIGGAVVLLAGAISLLLWMNRSRDKSALHVSDVAGAPPSPSGTKAAPAGAGAKPAGGGAGQVGAAGEPEANFPLPSPDQMASRPQSRPISPAERRHRQRAAIELVDDSIAQFDAQRASAEASGDAATAERLRIRVERLRSRRRYLQSELEKDEKDNPTNNPNPVNSGQKPGQEIDNATKGGSTGETPER